MNVHWAIRLRPRNWCVPCCGILLREFALLGQLNEGTVNVFLQRGKESVPDVNTALHVPIVVGTARAQA